MIKIITIICSLFFILYGQSNYSKINNVAQKALNHPALTHGFWSLYAVNSETGKVIIDVNSQKVLAPASNQKLLTSAAALALIGPEEVLHTFLEYTGTLKNGVLNGDLFIRGEGDPTLGSCKFDTSRCMDTQIMKWITAVKQHGILKIEGNIIGDDS